MTQPQPTKIKILDPLPSINPTQPVGQPNPCTTLCLCIVFRFVAAAPLGLLWQRTFTKRC